VIETYLFDWGDTLMIDFPGVPGKMCDWDVVEMVEGAQEVLSCLSKSAEIYIATGAVESTEKEIAQAFARVGLSQYITGYFCKANTGLTKGTSQFLEHILEKLGKPVANVAMVGDSLKKDIEPAAAIGIKPIWVTSLKSNEAPENTLVIPRLRELCM